MTVATESPTVGPITLHAIDVAMGREQIAADAPAIRVKGAANDYNSRGRGSTMARRVLRDGAWQWLSAPASKGRYTSSDRNDVQYGDAWEGEIIAEYTLGGRSAPKPNGWYIVKPHEKPLTIIQSATKRRDGQWALTLPNGETLVVSDPAWR